MKALIVDDHKINRGLLKLLIKDYFPRIKKVDEADSVKATLELLEIRSYDVIFLDIELTDGVGFDALNEVSDFVYIIVISSHPKYALEAFKHNVVDYILKPINIDEFKAAVKKAFEMYDKGELLKRVSEETTSDSVRLENQSNLMVNYKNGYLAISKDSILYIKAQGKCSEIYVEEGKHYTSYKNLKEFENVLSTSFVRIHHSYLVNTSSISYFSRETSLLRLTNGKELPVSTRKKDELFKKFNIF